VWNIAGRLDGFAAVLLQKITKAASSSSGPKFISQRCTRPEVTASCRIDTLFFCHLS